MVVSSKATGSTAASMEREPTRLKVAPLKKENGGRANDSTLMEEVPKKERHLTSIDLYLLLNSTMARL